MTLDRNKAFTLIELLVVVAIISLLSKIPPPKNGAIAYYRYTASGSGVKCSDQNSAAPYILLFSPETQYFNSLPTGQMYYSGSWGSDMGTFSGYKCVSI